MADEAKSAPEEARFCALVLAGQRPGGDPLLNGRSEPHKALIPVAGRPMIERVVLALKQCPRVARIAVSLEDPGLLSPLDRLQPLVESGRLTVLPSAATPSLSTAEALRLLSAPYPLLVTTADHPLLTPELVERFCAESLAGGAAVTVGLTKAEAVERVAPGSRRTYLKFRDGRFTGTNLFALMHPEAEAAVAFWRRVEAERKRPWRIARRFGPLLLLGYLLRLWTLSGALTRAGRPLGASAAAVVLADGRAGIDVDKPADLELVERLLSGGA